MKKQTQVRRNGSTAAVHSQTKTPQREDSLGLFSEDAYAVCLCTFDRVAGAPVRKIPLSEGEFESLLMRNLGGDLEQFVADAIRAQLRAPSQDQTSRMETPSPSVRPETASPMIALWPEGEDHGLSEEIIDLTKEEYAALKQASGATGSGVLMFMANAALEKAAASSDEKAWRNQCNLEPAVYQAIGCLHILGNWISQKIIEETHDVGNVRAAGIFHLAEASSDRLLIAFNEDWETRRPKGGLK